MMKAPDCIKGGPLGNGDCCCNCKWQKKVMCHPWNGNNKAYGWLEDKIKIGKGPINKQLGWLCTATPDDGPSDEYIFFDFEHSLCEMHERKEIV